ncbi:hypothetical protein MHW47_10825 [Streptomyces sp. OfavH-34-F]|uniref:hypothetical protein n=1 Tax=Streptomyces sp. OfavH-34-F TaxID=2917760 RepID=UPI001EF2AF5A|nr:hypothetical protein [Streptomyces sp. OfavH-34-F]MCG7524927.1 hypothetical protein [Streptomyces sp. OfavH-34-F]
MAAPAQRTQRRARPIAGTRPSVRLDDEFARDLAVLMETGNDLTAAMRTAVCIVANMYRTAWHHGVVPVGTAPTLRSYRFVEKPPFVGPQSLPQVDHDGPRWTHGSSLTSSDDGRRQQQPTYPTQRQQAQQQHARP